MPGTPLRQFVVVFENTDPAVEIRGVLLAPEGSQPGVEILLADARSRAVDLLEHGVQVEVRRRLGIDSLEGFLFGRAVVEIAADRVEIIGRRLLSGSSGGFEQRSDVVGRSHVCGCFLQCILQSGSSGRGRKPVVLGLPLKQASYACACIARAMPSAIWSMAPWSLPPIIIFIIMFSSMCSTSRMRVSVSETLWS